MSDVNNVCYVHIHSFPETTYCDNMRVKTKLRYLHFSPSGSCEVLPAVQVLASTVQGSEN